MPSEPILPESLAVALRLEAEFDWIGAVKAYGELLSETEGRNEKPAVAVIARRANALFNAAFQSADPVAYKASIESSKEAYGLASSMYRENNDDANAKYCSAMEKTCEFAQESRRELAVGELDESLQLLESAIERFDMRADEQRCAAITAWFSNVRDYTNIANISEYGSKVDSLKTQGEKYCSKLRTMGQDFLGRVALTTGLAHFSIVLLNVAIIKDYAKNEQEMKERIDEAYDVGKSLENPLPQFWLNCTGAEADVLAASDERIERAVSRAEEAIALAGKLRNAWYSTIASRQLIQALEWRLKEVDEQKKAREILARIERVYRDAEKYSGKGPSTLSSIWMMAMTADWLRAHELTAELVPEVATRNESLRARLNEAQEKLTLSDNVFWKGYLASALGRTWARVATFSDAKEEKLTALSQAIKYLEIDKKGCVQEAPSMPWDVGISFAAMGSAQLDRALLEDSAYQKILLPEAAANLDRGIHECLKDPDFDSSMWSQLGYYSDALVKALQALRALGGDISDESILSTIDRMIDFYGKSGQYNRQAEAYWKRALDTDSRANFHDSVAAYSKASEAYQKAALLSEEALSNDQSSVRILVKYFTDFSVYMKGWAFASEAKAAHDDDKLEVAQENYSRAADAFGGTSNWGYLRGYYLGCSLIEHGESLSRSERLEQARNVFSQASYVFQGVVAATSLLQQSATSEERRRDLNGVGMLATGHAALCTARAFGVDLASNFSDDKLGGAKEELENAANAYFKGGYEGAERWTKAIEELYYAFASFRKAESETQAVAKTSAEEHMTNAKALLLSVTTDLARREEVEKWLVRANEEKKLLLSFPPGTASFQVNAFGIKSFAGDLPFDLRRQEKALLISDFFFHPLQGRVNQDAKYDLRIINVGQLPAVLVEVDELLPANCDLLPTHLYYHIEGNVLHFDGKRLDPVTTTKEIEKIDLELRMAKKGKCELKPRVLYDYEGKKQAHDVDSVVVEITEIEPNPRIVRDRLSQLHDFITARARLEERQKETVWRERLNRAEKLRHEVEETINNPAVTQASWNDLVGQIDGLGKECKGMYWDKLG